MKKGMVLAVLLAGALLAFAVSLCLRESADTPQTIALGPGDSLVAKHMNGMRAELIAFSKSHPILKGIEKTNFWNTAQPPIVCSQFECKKTTQLRDAGCRLYFCRNTAWKDYVQMSILEPTSNGICLSSIVDPSYYHAVNIEVPTAEHWDLQNGKDELYLTYKLKLGENVKHLEAPIRKILRDHLQALRDDILKQGGWVETGHTQNY